MATAVGLGKTWTQKGGFAMGYLDNEEVVLNSARTGKIAEDRFAQRTPGHNVFNDGLYAREDGKQFDREEFPEMRANSGWWWMELFYKNGWSNYTMPRDNISGTHSMWDSLFKPFVSAQNVGASHKPVIDLSRPMNAQSREDLTREYGGFQFNPLTVTQWSNSHFMWSAEVVPYADTYSTRDCVAGAYLTGNLAAAGTYVQTYYVEGGQTYRNPRNAWAHRLTALFKFARLQAGLAVGVGGYFVGYEFFYTHVPWMRIRDPRPEQWKTPWRDGQSTFTARAAAACFPCLGHALYTGSLRRFPVYFPMWQAANLFYEMYRWGFSSSPLIWKQLSAPDEDLRAREGSLEPGNVQRIDPNTGRPRAMASYNEWRKQPGRDLANPIDNPGHYDTYRWSNPSFNPLNGPQGFQARPVKTVNDSWDLVNPLEFELYGAGATRESIKDYNPRVITGPSYSQFTTEA